MKKILTLLLLTCLFLPALQAEDKVETGAAPKKQRPKVGLVLSGGGAKGMAHIGALKIIEEMGIPIDYVVGTSIGSIIGGFYALGYNADELDSLVRAQDWNLLMKDQVDRRKITYFRKEDNDRYILNIPFMNHKNLTEQTEAGSNKTDILRHMPTALVQGQNLDQLFTKLSVGYQDDIDFNTLPIPFACVAVDLNTKEEVVFHSGNIVTAIRSSMSIPGYFNPVQLGDKYLVDGGMINNLPVDVVKEMGADYVITIDLHHFKKTRPDNRQTIPEMLSTMLSIMNGEKYHSGIAASDIVISPNVSAYGVLSFDDRSVDALVDSGRVAALKVVPQLKSLAEHLKTYPESDRVRPPHAVNLSQDSVLISQLEIRGSDAKDMAWLLSKTDIAPGKYVTGQDMDEAMDFFYNTRCFIKAGYSVAGTQDEGYRLKLNLTPQRIHQAGLGFRFDSEEMASLLIGMSLNKRKLFGSKFDFETELGVNMHASLAYGYTFRNLTKLTVSARFQHVNIDCYDLADFNTDKTTYRLTHSDRYNVFNAEAAYQLYGWRSSEISFGAHYDNYSWMMIRATPYGDDSGISSIDHAWYGFLRWKFDNLDDSWFPKQGMKFNLTANGGSSTIKWFSMAQFDFKAAIPLGERVTLLPQLYNRWVFGYPIHYYVNYVGGLMPGRYLDAQMPFVGINHAYNSSDWTDIARADLCINLFKQHYLTLMGNYMLQWEPNAFSLRRGDLGLGAAYAINTIVGPIQLVAHWSTLSRRPGFYFSLGFDF